MNTKSKSPSDVVKTFLTAMEMKDYETGLHYIGAACDYDNGPLGRFVGPDGVRSILEPFFAPTLENEFRILREVAQGSIVMLERLDRHRLADKWVELPVTGVFEVHDGLITVWHDYFDANTIVSQWPAS